VWGGRHTTATIVYTSPILVIIKYYDIKKKKKSCSTLLSNQTFQTTCFRFHEQTYMKTSTTHARPAPKCISSHKIGFIIAHVYILCECIVYNMMSVRISCDAKDFRSIVTNYIANSKVRACFKYIIVIITIITLSRHRETNIFFSAFYFQCVLYSAACVSSIREIRLAPTIT